MNPPQAQPADDEQRLRRISELTLRMKILCKDYSNKEVKEALKEFLGSMNLRPLSVFTTQAFGIGVSQQPKVTGAPNPQKKKTRSPEEIGLIENLEKLKKRVKDRSLELKTERLDEKEPVYKEYMAALAAMHSFRTSRGNPKTQSKTEVPSSTGTTITSQTQSSISAGNTQKIITRTQAPSETAKQSR